MKAKMHGNTMASQVECMSRAYRDRAKKKRERERKSEATKGRRGPGL
jgi:hypothetical protein